MNARHILLASALAAASTLVAAVSLLGPSRAAPPAEHRGGAVRVAGSFGRLPLAFEENRGQFDSAVRFAARARGGAVALLSDGVAVAGNGTGLRFSVVGAQASVEPEGEDLLPGEANYFIGSDPTRWIREVPLYARVRYRGIRPGVDLVFHGNGRQLEYDFELSPGASLESLRVSFEGPRAVSVDERGGLRLATANAEAAQSRPRVFQQRAEAMESLAGRYRVTGPREVGFDVAGWDGRSRLLIDPVLDFSSYLGGNQNEGAEGLALDSAGNIYIGSATSSANFPMQGAFQAVYDGGATDAVVVKLSPTGDSIIYSTYVGGSADEDFNGLAVDGAGSAYLTGDTLSDNFPTQSPFQGTRDGGRDGFVTKLSPSGSSLDYSTYLGGRAQEKCHAIAVDNAGSAYVTGYTFSTNYPVVNAFQPSFAGDWDMFVTKLSPAGNALAYSTFIGGSTEDFGIGIAVDDAGSAYLNGYTLSADFPTTANAPQPMLMGFYEGFAMKLDPSGALAYSTFLGGPSDEYGYGVAVDGMGNAIFVGKGYGDGFPLVNAIQGFVGGGADAYVVKVNPTGTFVYSTFLGGTSNEECYGVAVDGAGNAYVTGRTGSTDFPTLNPFQAAMDGGEDAYLAKLSPTGALVYSTYLGGSLGETGRKVAVDSAGGAYVTGGTDSPNFPTLSPLQAVIDGGSDLFITKFDPYPPPAPVQLAGVYKVSCDCTTLPGSSAFGIAVVATALVGRRRRAGTRS